MQNKLQRAISMAKKAHAGQVRKYTNEPYITHPFAVAGLVTAVTDNEDMVVAAILHDVVEDTDVTIAEVAHHFGTSVSIMVGDLTDTSVPSDGNRAARRAIDRAHTAQINTTSKTIKLADLINNTQTIAQYAPDFAKIYMAEKKLLLEVLTEGDPTLFKIADDLVRRFYA